MNKEFFLEEIDEYKNRMVILRNQILDSRKSQEKQINDLENSLCEELELLYKILMIQSKLYIPSNLLKDSFRTKINETSKYMSDKLVENHKISKKTFNELKEIMQNIKKNYILIFEKYEKLNKENKGYFQENQVKLEVIIKKLQEYFEIFDREEYFLNEEKKYSNLFYNAKNEMIKIDEKYDLLVQLYSRYKEIYSE